MYQLFLRIVILLLLIAPNFLFAQFSVAGVSGLYYSDVVPDTIIDPNINSNGSHYPPDKMFEFDMNQDGTNDVRIKSHFLLSNGYYERTVLVNCINPSFTIAYNSTDSTYNNYLTYWMVRNILKKYSTNDTVHKTNFIPVSSCYLAFYLAQTGSYASSNQWVDANDNFFGVRYINTGDTLYGWVKVNVGSLNSCTVKEYSLGNNYVGINEITRQNSFSISPNPAINNIYIESVFNNDDIIVSNIFDVTGKIVHETHDLKKAIQISNLNNGLYFIRIETKSEVVVKKIIVSH